MSVFCKGRIELRGEAISRLLEASRLPQALRAFAMTFY
jgi:hypothetical protein